MTQNDFVYWLQGYVELNGEVPTPEQWEVIKEHLALVFTKVTTNTVNISEDKSKDDLGKKIEEMITRQKESKPSVFDKPWWHQKDDPYRLTITC